MGILIVGNDKRQIALFELLLSEGYEVKRYDGDIGKGETVILPLPLSRDGVTVNTVPALSLADIISVSHGRRFLCGAPSPEFVRELEKNAALVYDYNSDESFLYENARITAEAAVAIAISELPSALFGIRALIIGFGRIAKILAKYLSALGARVTVCARRDTDLAYARALGYNAYCISNGFSRPLPEGADVIFNTAPSKIIDANACDLLLPAPIIDLAGRRSVSEYEGCVIPALALPAKYSPVSAAAALFNSVKERLGRL